MDILRFHNDFNKLVEILPKDIVDFLSKIKVDDIIEIVMDLGRNPEIRHADGKTEYIDNRLVTEEDIEHTTSKLQPFTHDNRSGIPGTLHRISAIRNRQGKVVGLTCRIGRVVTGTIECIKDFVMQNVKYFENDEKNCIKVDKIFFKRKILFNKFTQAFVRLFAPLL